MRPTNTITARRRIVVQLVSLAVSSVLTVLTGCAALPE